MVSQTLHPDNEFYSELKMTEQNFKVLAPIILNVFSLSLAVVKPQNSHCSLVSGLGKRKKENL